MNERTGYEKIFRHRCDSCRRDFLHVESREDLIKQYRTEHPTAELSTLRIFCSDCIKHIKENPQTPHGLFVFKCPGCGMSHMRKSFEDPDDFPVFNLRINQEPVRVCESCYEVGMSKLN